MRSRPRKRTAERLIWKESWWSCSTIRIEVRTGYRFRQRSYGSRLSVEEEDRSGIHAPIPAFLPRSIAPQRLHGKGGAVPQRVVGQVDPAALVGQLISIGIIPGLEVRVID